VSGSRSGVSGSSVRSSSAISGFYRKERVETGRRPGAKLVAAASFRT
jgi:hypothetical protein